jgi:cbb3-type cytochrome oxidase subunit 3
MTYEYVVKAYRRSSQLLFCSSAFLIGVVFYAFKPSNREAFEQRSQAAARLRIRTPICRSGSDHMSL